MFNNISYISRSYFFTLKTLEQIPSMSLRRKKVCPVYNTYPITELIMYWLIQWHLCVYKGVKLKAGLVKVSASIRGPIRGRPFNEPSKLYAFLA